MAVGEAYNKRARAIGDVVLHIESGNNLMDRLNALAAEEGPGTRSVRAARDRVADAIEMLWRAQAACMRASNRGEV